MQEIDLLEIPPTPSTNHEMQPSLNMPSGMKHKVPAAGSAATDGSGWPVTKLLSVFITCGCFIGFAAYELTVACPLVVQQTRSLQMM